MSLVRVTNIAKRYRLRGGELATALDDISFTVAPGECVGVIGRNGSGKTTLLRLLAGVTRPDSGSLAIDGSFAAIIETTGGIEVDASGHENLRNLLILQGVAADQLDHLLHRACHFADLGSFLHEPVRTYSEGMVMRLGFAGVIFLDVDLLLVDEVLSVGDPVFQRKCANEIRRFVGNGGTMILASHNYHEVAALCQRVILLDAGRVLIDGASDQVFRTFWQRNEQDLMRITSQAEQPGPNPLKAHTPLAESTGELRIESVTVLDRNNQDTRDLVALDRVTFEVRVVATRPVDSPLCRIQMHRADGLFITGSNTLRHQLATGEISGRGIFRLTYEALPLAEGEYYLSIGLWPDEYASFIAERAYDFWENAFILRVTQERRHGGGLIASHHSWSYEPA
jgi:ABC-type polysaccharide/polyol phosphate transport system ATPase subunit